VAAFTEFNVLFILLRIFSTSAVTFSYISHMIKTAFVRITSEHFGLLPRMKNQNIKETRVSY